MKKMILLAGAAAILCAAAWFLNDSRKMKTPSLVGKKVLASFDLSEVAKIECGSGVKKLALASTDAGWVISSLYGYPAEIKKIRENIMKLLDLKVGDVARGLAALVRLRQKASMIRVEHTVAAAKAARERGYQVLIATEMVTTAAHPVAEMLEADGIPVARIYGSNPEAEAERMRFQRGEAPVVVFNTPTAINLQAGEQFADGTFATDTPRRGFFMPEAQPRCPVRGKACCRKARDSILRNATGWKSRTPGQPR